MPTLSAPNSATVSFTVPNAYLTVDCTSGAVANVSWASPGGVTGSRVVRNTSDDIGPFADNTIVTVQCVSGACTYQSSVDGGGIGPVAVSGTPTVGQVPVATSSTTAVWAAVSGGGGVVMGASRPIFAARLQSTVTPEVPTAGVTTTFTRNFDLSVLSSTDGIYSNVTHNTAGFGFVRAAGRAFLQGSTPAANVINSGGTELRDLTLSGWVKTNATAAKTSTGIDGIANSASNLTASADAATCLYTTTAGAAARTFQPFIRRRSGLGRVWITADNGANWTDVTAQIGKPGGVYRRVDVQSSAANPVCGFRLEYNGDAIDIDSACCVASAYAINPLMVRGADVQGTGLTYAGAKVASIAKAFKLRGTVISDGQGTVSLTVKPSSGSGQFAMTVAPSGTVPSAQLIAQSGTIIYNNTPRYILRSASVQPGVPVQLELLYAAGAAYGYANGDLCVVYDAQTPATHDVSGFTDLTVTLPNNCQIGDLCIDEWTGRVVVLLGDSITARDGYARAWFGAMPDAAILNKGVGGDTVAQVLARTAADLAYALPTTSTCDVVLWCGTNSMAAAVAPATALADLQSVVNAIKAINADARVTLVSTITNRTGGFSGGQTTGGFLTASQTYNAGLAGITGVRNVVEINGADMGVDTAGGSFIQDGVHPFDYFYPRMVKKIAAAVL